MACWPEGEEDGRADFFRRAGVFFLRVGAVVEGAVVVLASALGLGMEAVFFVTSFPFVLTVAFLAVGLAAVAGASVFFVGFAATAPLFAGGFLEGSVLVFNGAFLGASVFEAFFISFFRTATISLLSKVFFTEILFLAASLINSSLVIFDKSGVVIFVLGWLGSKCRGLHVVLKI